MIQSNNKPYLKKDFTALVIADIHITDTSDVNVYTRGIDKIKGGFKPDVIVFLGDYVWKNDYKLAIQNKLHQIIEYIKKSFSLQNDRLVFIPGNHDYDRNFFLATTNANTNTNTNTIADENGFNKFISSDKQVVKEALSFWEEKAFKKYNDFLKKYAFKLPYKNSKNGLEYKSCLFGIKQFHEFDVSFVCTNMNWGGAGDSIDKFTEKVHFSPELFKQGINMINANNPEYKPTIISLVHYPFRKWGWKDQNNEGRSKLRTAAEDLINDSDFIFFGDDHVTQVANSTIDFSKNLESNAESQKYNTVTIDFCSAQMDGGKYCPSLSILHFTESHNKVMRKDFTYNYNGNGWETAEQVIYSSSFIKDIIAFTENNQEAFNKFYGKNQPRPLTQSEFTKKVNEGELVKYILEKHIFYNDTFPQHGSRCIIKDGFCEFCSTNTDSKTIGILIWGDKKHNFKELQKCLEQNKKAFIVIYIVFRNMTGSRTLKNSEKLKKQLNQLQVVKFLFNKNRLFYNIVQI